MRWWWLKAWQMQLRHSNCITARHHAMYHATMTYSDLSARLLTHRHSNHLSLPQWRSLSDCHCQKGEDGCLKAVLSVHRTHSIPTRGYLVISSTFLESYAYSVFNSEAILNCALSDVFSIPSPGLSVYPQSARQSTSVCRLFPDGFLL